MLLGTAFRELKICKSHCHGGVNVVLSGGFAVLCYWELHSESCKSHCHGGVKVGLRRCARGKCTHRVANRIRK